MMTIFENAELKEMTMDDRPPSLCSNDKIETVGFVDENRYAEVSLQEIRAPGYSIRDIRICSRENLKILRPPEGNDTVWFCAVLQGDTLCFNHTSKGEEYWRNGEANLLTHNNSSGYICFGREQPFHMLGVMFSTVYLEQKAALYPDLFGKIVELHTKRQFLRAFPEHIFCCPEMTKAICELQNYEAMGNAAQMYLDAKLSEILSLFLCRRNKKDCSSCGCHAPDNRDLLLHAKSIVEREYLNPPSLHELALMVGTNECTLKNGFKKMFGITVFGYLFDYRMEMACRYLSDADMTIQEIAESVGYDYHSHFTAAFKRKFYMSPQEYRWRKGENDRRGAG